MRRRISAIQALRAFTFCLLLLGWCGTDWAQEIRVPESRKGIRTAPILLLCREEIQAELGLRPEVIAQAKSMASDLHRRAAFLHGKTGSGVLTARRIIDEEQTRWLNKNLSAAQLDRLHQLDLQWEGPTAFVSRPIIAEYLNITPQQRESIAKSINLMKNQTNPTQSPPDSEDRFSDQALALLTDPQRDQWKALLGKPFAFRRDSPSQDAQISKTRTDPAR